MSPTPLEHLLLLLLPAACAAQGGGPEALAPLRGSAAAAAAPRGDAAQAEPPSGISHGEPGGRPAGALGTDQASGPEQMHAWRRPDAANTSATRHEVGGTRCLCLFDVDRTLTGKQQRTDLCPGNEVVPGVRDESFGGGTLTLSLLGQFLDSTDCSRCKLGILSQGSGGSRAMRTRLSAMLRGGPMVFDCAHKPRCARDLASQLQVSLHDVYFFDDKAANVRAFEGTGINAAQVSCGTRDLGGIGLCGATPPEVLLTSGVHICG